MLKAAYHLNDEKNKAGFQLRYITDRILIKQLIGGINSLDSYDSVVKSPKNTNDTLERIVFIQV